MRIVKRGDRVSGTIKDQSFTGTVTTVNGRDGRSAVDSAGTWTVLVPATPTSVHIATDAPLTMPSGRTVHGAHLRGPDEIAALTFLDEAAAPPGDGTTAA